MIANFKTSLVPELYLVRGLSDIELCNYQTNWKIFNVNIVIDSSSIVIQSAPLISNSLISNFVLFRTKVCFPWVCPCFLCYVPLLISNLCISNPHFSRTIFFSRGTRLPCRPPTSLKNCSLGQKKMVLRNCECETIIKLVSKHFVFQILLKVRL